MTPHSSRRQQGATLVVGMIMLAVIMLMVATAFNLSRSSLHSVGNMQFRNEALAAANKALEQVMSSAFTTSTAPQPVNVDIDNNDTIDYVVSVSAPVCVRATQAGSPTLSSISLGPALSTAATWNTVWEIDATVADPKSGANVRTRSGIRVLRSQAQKDAECP